MRYFEKSAEEIRPIVELYCDSYKNRMGQIDRNEIAQKLINLAIEKEQTIFQSAFESFTPNALRMAASMITENDYKDSPQEDLKTVETQKQAIIDDAVPTESVPNRNGTWKKRKDKSKEA